MTSKDIAYRQVKHDAKCSICEVDIFKNDERVIVLPCRYEKKSSYIICNDCFSRYRRYSNFDNEELEFYREVIP